MQSVVPHSAWTGRKTFALARCTDSGDKRRPPRSRRTKEERKTMVESFIKKYQNLNNGKFPSLNLTHKEVGGSFYTVREIVREIIQQNRVLRPGNSTSKALNLEYCPEELAGKSLSVDISDPLSISTINYAVDQGQGESLSPNEYRQTSTDIIEVDESVTVSQEYPESHPNDTFASQVPNGERCSEISNDEYLNGKLDGSSSNEPNLGKLSVVEDENLGVRAQIYSEVQVHSCPQISGKVEHLVPSFEAVSMTPPLIESLVIGDDNGNTSNFMTKEINSSVASSSTLSDSVSEANILLNPIPTSPCDGENPPLSPGIESCNAGKSQKIMGVTTSLEVPKTSGFDEVEVASIAFEKDSLINKSEATETLSSIGFVEGSAASSSRQLSMEKDSIQHKPETLEALSSAAVDEVSGVNLNQSVSQNLDSPSLGIRRPPVSFDPTETLSSIVSDEISDESLNGSASQNLDRHALGNRSPVVLPLSQPNAFEKVVTNVESNPVQSIRPSFKGRTYSEVKPLHEHSLSNMGSAKNSGSISDDEGRKAYEKSENNPVWTAIKSLLKAVVKFWTE